MKMLSDIILEKATIDKWDLLQRLLFLYAYDFSEYTGDEISECGDYNLGRLLRYYWNGRNPDPIIIKVKGNIAGFVMIRYVNYHSHDRLSIAEFFVMKKYSRQGIGSFVARNIFERHKSKWYLDVITTNKPADNFWNNVISNYTEGDYNRKIDKERDKIVYTFSNA